MRPGWTGRAWGIVTGVVLALAAAPAAHSGILPGILPPAGAHLQAQQVETRVDSARLRLEERLRRLARPPGADTVPLDSLALDSLAAAARGGRSSRDRGRSAAPADSTLAALMEALPGYEMTSYQGIRAEYGAESRELYLYADSARPAELRRPDGNELSAREVIIYEQGSGEVEALGAPTFTPSDGDPISSRRLVFDTERRAGSAYEASTEYSQMGGTTWNVDGDLPLVTGNVAYGDHSRFTSCELEDPHYHFEAQRLKIVQNNILVARPVTLYFADVPVAWLPFVFQSITQGRSSGILAPRFSVNDIVRTSGNYQRRVSNVGFYWAINDYMDATVALDWFSDNYTALTGNFRYRWLRQFLQGSLSVRSFWRVTGSREYSLDTQQSWQMSERTSLNASGRWSSSTAFVRENSFDPREVTQEIRSQGGLQHRFDWGNLSLSADRAQSLSDDRVSMSLPRLNLSLSPITLFEAPASRASWYNNLTWNGSTSFSRRLVDRPDPEEGFSFSAASNVNTEARLNSSFTLGRFSLSQSLNVTEEILRDVPVDTLPFVPDGGGVVLPAMVDRDHALGLRQPGDFTDISERDLSWTLSAGYQQTLIGTTTLTPSLGLSGRMRQADTLEVAQNLVSAPTQINFGATLKADVYGFYGGIAGYEAIRHKVTPTFTYTWSPEVRPTELQRQVFGSSALRPRSALQIGLNQTWEAKRPVEESEADTSMDGAPLPDSAAVDSAGQPVPAAAVQDSAALDPGPVDLGGEEDEPRRLERGEIVNLLSLRTQAVTYDFVEADSAGQFLQGFTTTRVQNQVSSDFLRGLTIAMTHDLWDDQTDPETGEIDRSFAPHLSRLNFSFALNQRSTLIRWLGLGGDPSRASAAADDGGADPTAVNEPFEGTGATDESAIIPGGSDAGPAGTGRTAGGGGPWRANFSYSLNRPRREGARTSQLLSMNMSMSPTENWELRWTTGYDLEEGSFNDHRVRLTRDLHRWQAIFGFFRTATGNWTFRFEVSLTDNRDLHFDYEQRSLQVDGGG